jgi:UDP-2,3-diacylglucosamine hydrolase
VSAFINSPATRESRRLTLAAPTISANKTVGLLAGSGRFPVLFAEGAKRQGYKIACMGIRYEAPEVLREICDSYEVVGVSRLGGMIRSFRRRGVDRVVMAGKVTKSVMYTPFRIVRLCPDLRMIRFWYGALRSDHRDDSILLQLIAEFAKDGITFDSALDYCPELLVKDGVLTRRTPTAGERKDIEFGWTLAKEMGRLDVGQSVAVKEQSALAVEAIEGTDRCIERAGNLCRAGGWTLVKVAKPLQDMRFDVPTVGVDTIENLHKARARVLAIEANKTIMVDQDKVVALADRYGLSIVALTAPAA